jgi:hypothetical protein
MPETGASHVRVMTGATAGLGAHVVRGIVARPGTPLFPPLFLSSTRWKVCILWSQLILEEKKKYGWSAQDTLAGCTNVGY